MQVALDAEPEATPNRGDLGEARVTQFGCTEAMIAETERGIAVFGIELREQPRRCPAEPVQMR